MCGIGEMDRGVGKRLVDLFSGANYRPEPFRSKTKDEIVVAPLNDRPYPKQILRTKHQHKRDLRRTDLIVAGGCLRGVFHVRVDLKSLF